MRQSFLIGLSLILGLTQCDSVFAQALYTYNTFGDIKARQLGPATSSGRITAIEALYLATEPGRPDRRLCIYVGTAAGGVFKSKDNGVTFQSIFDKEKQHSIGAMALDPGHQDSILWLGTGESNVRNSVSIGGGLYKTTDAGKTWKLIGLEKVERIAKIAINPKNTDVVFVAGLGALWGDSQDRGLYRTSDGGKSFERVLYVDDKTGCADVVIDPENPQIVYAAMWQFRRTAYSFNSGGPGSGLYKSVDGGQTWSKLSADLPEGDLGRIILAIAPSRPSTVYAVVEAKKSALYCSDDRGLTWQQRSSAVSVTARPFYFSCLYVDPFDHNRLYRPSFQLGISNDGGRTFNGFEYGGGAHPDHHALWIDPLNPQHLLLGTDGGVYRTYDRGVTWVQFRNLPLAQFYRISYDFSEPYNIFGGLQDNGSWMVASRIPGGAIQNRHWNPTGWGDGFAVIRDRQNPDIIYFESQGGEAVRRHFSSSETKSIKPKDEPGGKKLRFNWNTPIAQSPTNPKTLYIGSNYLHRSNNHGDTWQIISPDLTTNDSTKYNPEKSGGVTADNTSAENHCTIFSIAESPKSESVIWVGTDDGQLHVTKDGGRTWTEVAKNLPRQIPSGTWVACVEPSWHNPAVAFAAFDNHTRGDLRAYFARTGDYGATWQLVTSDTLRGFAHVIREDLVNPNLLFAGTELGLFISIDGGANWASFKGMPHTPVRDLQIHPRDGDLIIATHGLGAYIIDDLQPLRQLSIKTLGDEIVLLPSRPEPLRFAAGFQEFSGSDEFIAYNYPGGAPITYFQKSRHLVGDMKIDIIDKNGAVLATVPAGKRKGINRLYWGGGTKPPKTPRSPNAGGISGPIVLPGTYTVRITKNGKTYDGQTTIVHDKQSVYSLDDRTVQNDVMNRLYGMTERLAWVVEQTHRLRDSANMAKPALSPELQRAAEILVTRLDSLMKTMVADKNSLFADTEDKLREKVMNLYSNIGFFPGRPSEDQMEQISKLQAEIVRRESKIAEIRAIELAELNRGLKNAGKQELQILTRDEFMKLDD